MKLVFYYHLEPKKKHIIGQYILELLMTSVISMIISLFLTFGLTKITTNFLFETTQQNSASNILLESTLEETNTTEITDFELTDETWRIILIYIALILSSEIVVIKIYIEKVSLKELLNGE